MLRRACHAFARCSIPSTVAIRPAPRYSTSRDGGQKSENELPREYLHAAVGAGIAVATMSALYLAIEAGILPNPFGSHEERQKAGRGRTRGCTLACAMNPLVFFVAKPVETLLSFL